MKKIVIPWQFIGVLLWLSIALYVTLVALWAIAHGFSPAGEVAIRIINGFLMFIVLFFLGWKLSQREGLRGAGGLLKLIASLDLAFTLSDYLF